MRPMTPFATCISTNHCRREYGTHTPSCWALCSRLPGCNQLLGSTQIRLSSSVISPRKWLQAGAGTSVISQTPGLKLLCPRICMLNYNPSLFHRAVSYTWWLLWICLHWEQRLVKVDQLKIYESTGSPACVPTLETPGTVVTRFLPRLWEWTPQSECHFPPSQKITA